MTNGNTHSTLQKNGIVGIEQIHPGMIEVGKKPITQNTDIQKEFSRLRPVEEDQTHTPEYHLYLK